MNLAIKRNHSFEIGLYLESRISRFKNDYSENHNCLNINICLIQDPYHIENRLYGAPSTWTTHWSRGNNAVIVCSNPHLVINKQLVTETSAFITLMVNDSEFISIGTQYIPPSREVTECLEEWEGEYQRLGRHPFIISGDLNANSPVWGQKEEDERGREMLDFVTINDQQILNDPEASPSFQTCRARGWPDLTLRNNLLYPFITDWEVTTHETLSDLKLITFTYKGSVQTKKSNRFKTEYVKP